MEECRKGGWGIAQRCPRKPQAGAPLRHATTHPEREERLLYTQDQVIEEGLFDIDGIHELKPDLVNAADIQRVHFCVPDIQHIMTESHYISAGGAKSIGRAVMEKNIDAGFAVGIFS